MTDTVLRCGSGSGEGDDVDRCVDFLNYDDGRGYGYGNEDRHAGGSSFGLGSGAGWGNADELCFAGGSSPGGHGSDNTHREPNDGEGNGCGWGSGNGAGDGEGRP